jgi:hypothetical protein
MFLQKSNKQNNVLVFLGILKLIDESGSGSASESESGSISQRHVSADPDPDPQHCLKVSRPTRLD